MRRRLLWGALGALVLLLVAVLVLAYLLFNTRWGLDQTLALANRYAPVQIQAERTRGNLSDGATFEGLTIEGDTWRLELDRARLDWSPLALTERDVLVESLVAGSGRLALTPGDEPSEPGIQLPNLDFGWDIDVDQATIEQLTVQVGDDKPVTLRDIVVAAELRSGVLEVATARAAMDDYRIALAARVDSTADFDHALTLALSEADQDLLDLTARGDAARTQLQVQSPRYQANGSAVVTDWAGDLAWSAELSLNQWESISDLSLDAEGTLTSGTGQLAGRYDEVPFAATISDASFADGIRVTVEPLTLPDQNLTVHGSLASTDFLRFDATADFVWDPPDRRVSGELTASGTMDAYEIEGQGLIDGQIGWQLTGRGDTVAMNPVTVTLTHQAAALQLAGQAQWSPDVAWQFQLTGEHLDPSLLYPDWPADLALAAQASGTDERADIDLQRVAGTLLDQPLTATGELQVTPAGLPKLDLDVRSGQSTVVVSGQWTDQRLIEGRLDVADLGHFLPGAAGSVAGQFSVQEQLARVDFTGTGIDWEGYAAQQLDVAGTLPVTEGIAADLAIDVVGLNAPGVFVDNGQVTVRGPWSELRVAANLASEQFGTARARLTADLSAAPQRFQIESLESDNPTYGRWELVAPTTVRYGGEQVQMDQACLQSVDRGELCASFAMEPERIGFAEVGLNQVSAGLFDLPLSVAVGEPLRLEGQLEGDARVEMRGMEPTDVTGRISSDQLAILMADRSPDPVAIDNLVATVDGGRERLQLAAEAGLESGQLTAELAITDPFGDTPAFAPPGEIRLAVPELSALDNLVPTVTGLKGRFDAVLALEGALSDPDLAGRFNVDGLSFLSAEYGTRVEDGHIEGRIGAEGRFELDGRLPSAGGVLTVTGEGRLDGTRIADLGLVIRGDDVRIADTPDLRLLASPNLRLSSDGERLRIRGRLEVDEAWIELGAGDARVRPSADVIVIRGEEQQEESESPFALPIDAEVELVLGDDVQLVGYGIEAELDGAVTVIERTGERTLGRGEIELTGTYSVYGQELSIDEGRLIFAGTPIEDPGLDISAYRQVQSVRAGVRVTGRATSPEVELYSDPAMEDSNILAYLLTGRPLDQTTTGESDYVSDAALALALRQGTEVTTALGSRLGFQQFGFTVREDLGGAAFAVGRYLAPDLYLRYTLGLLTPVDLLELEYRISEKWTLETRIGVETRVGINYRVERGAGSEDNEKE